MATNKTIILCILLLILIATSTVAIVDSATAQKSIDKADEKITELQKNGLPTLPLIDLLGLARRQYNNSEYNTSYNTSTALLTQADEIEELQKELLSTTEILKILSGYGEDTTSLEISLLFAKSDFEAANIRLSQDQLSKVKKSIEKVSKNYSLTFFFEIEEYKNIRGNESELFNNYYKSQKDLLDNNEYYEFLIGFQDFESIKEIISLDQKVQSNLELIEKKGISFNRSNDMIRIYEEYLLEKDYQSASSILTELNSLLETAIFLDEEILNLREEIDRLKELGIAKNYTEIQYDKILKEYEFENYLLAKTLLEQAKQDLIELEKEDIIFAGIKKASLKKGFKDFFLENWLFLLIFIVIISAGYYPAKIFIYLEYYKSSVSKANNEKDVLEKLQTQLQNQYFISHEGDKKSYKTDFSDYEKRRIELIDRITFLNFKIKQYDKKVEKIIVFLSKYAPFLAKIIMRLRTKEETELKK
ncbi:hypothetical protein GOV08_05525 [Candidatus Woesearchaeota archaeon]|nr:hypothetical protein [Candidatus Woesearchaeota archaeon]